MDISDDGVLVFLEFNIEPGFILNRAESEYAGFFFLHDHTAPLEEYFSVREGKG